MHELGIASSIFDIVKQYVPEKRAGQVRRVRVRVGEMAGVVPDSLLMCFDAVVANTPYRSAALDIEQVPMTGECAACGAAFSMAQPVFRCPVCRGIHVSLLSGRELLVSDVEVEDDVDIVAAVTKGVAS